MLLLLSIYYFNSVKGIVMKSTGSWYTVRSGENIVPCRVRGTFKLKGIKSTNPVTVGDNVDFEMTDDNTGVITALEPRKNYIARKSVKLSRQTHIIASNIDRAFIVATLAIPPTSSGFVDRFLLNAEAFHIPATILINKKDMYEEAELMQATRWKVLYESLGYQVHIISAKNESDVAALREQLKNGVNLFFGHSGVGKSTLINHLEPGLDLKTGQISLAHMRGTHTTTFSEMFPLTGGGYIIDTPGIREFGLIEFEKAEIGYFFPEIRKYAEDCQFNNCLHEFEPNCAVKKAVESGEIDTSRYHNYLSILHNEDKFN